MPKDIMDLAILPNSWKSMTTFIHYLLFGLHTRSSQQKVFDEVYSYEKGFAEHYRNHVLPQVQSFERQRNESLSEIRPRTFTAILLAAGTLFGAKYLWLSPLNNVEDVDSYILGGTVVIILGLIRWVYAPVSDYSESVKINIYPDIFKFFEPNFSYSFYPPIAATMMRELKDFDILPPRFDHEYNEDYITGVYKNVTIEHFATKLTWNDGVVGTGSTTTVFTGLIYLLDLKKSFLGKTVVVENGGAVSNWMRGNVGHMKPVNLEDPAFSKKFCVFSTDQVEARYLLTPAFMERLYLLTEWIGGDKFECSFFKEKLLIVISTPEENIKVASIFEPTTFIPESKLVLGKMNSLFGLIDHLKLRGIAAME